MVNDSVLVQRQVLRDLGVLISPNLKFEDYISNVISTACKGVGFIRRNSKGFTSVVLAHLFKTLVVPVLTFASVIWRPRTYLENEILKEFRDVFLGFLANR